MNKNERKVPRRIAQTILNSLKGGVVPRIGLPYIAVGRKNEIEALLHDVDIIAEGGDTDTNGAVAGALMGARMGYRALPETWVTGLMNKELLEERIERLIRHPNVLNI